MAPPCQELIGRRAGNVVEGGVRWGLTWTQKALFGLSVGTVGTRKRKTRPFQVCIYTLCSHFFLVLHLRYVKCWWDIGFYPFPNQWVGGRILFGKQEQRLLRQGLRQGLRHRLLRLMPCWKMNDH